MFFIAKFLLKHIEFMKLLEFTDSGIYCPPGKFYLDPWKPVDKR